MQSYCFHCMKPLTGGGICPHCGHSANDSAPVAPYHLKPGAVLHERFLVGTVLGEGGFGITYIGLDLTLAKRVAIKEFYPSGAANRTVLSSEIIVTQGKQNFFQQGIDRFLDEAKSVAAFSEEDGIVDVLDHFRENNTAYIVMEYLEGETLMSRVQNQGPFSTDDIISLMLPVMHSLKVIHAAGVIHRDISPDNIMLTKSGKLKLMDFGSARFYTNSDRKMSVVLKQGFAPAEQYSRNGEQGPFTDVYALCATIYTCITGNVPPDSIDRLRGDVLPPPSQLGVRISAAQESALMHGLSVSAETRCRSMDELIREFSGARAAGANRRIQYDRPPANYGQQGRREDSRPVTGYHRGTDAEQSTQYANSYNGAPVNGGNGYNNVPVYNNIPLNNVPVNNGNYGGAQYPGGYNYSYEPPQKPNNAPVIAAVIIASVSVMAVIGVLAYIFFANQSGTRPSETTAPISSFSTIYQSSDDSLSESSEEEATEEPETPPPATTKYVEPTTEKPTPVPTTLPPPTTKAPAANGWTESTIKSYIETYIVPPWTEDDKRMSESQSGGSSYDYVKCNNNRLWIGTKGSFHDDDEEKEWYFFDSNHRLYFVYIHRDDYYYRCYVANDEVIKYTTGDYDSTQSHYYVCNSDFNSGMQGIVDRAYTALSQTSY